MKIYQVEVVNGSFEDKIIKTIQCTTNLELAIKEAKIGAFDYEHCFIHVWENGVLIKFVEINFGFEEKLRNL